MFLAPASHNMFPFQFAFYCAFTLVAVAGAVAAKALMRHFRRSSPNQAG
jgi:hypothetical protein